MSTYLLTDRNSNVVIIVSADSEEEARKEATEATQSGVSSFRCEEEDEE